MRINHNLAALNASNSLKKNDSAISKNLQKLSSGYRINSAADDAAGLAVSEKMQAQINGLSQAEDNAANGISLVQTAEGGINETESILQRMNTLAVESANGTYDNTTDRSNLQKEINALSSEINTIAQSTNFNGIKLLDGSLGYTAAQTGITNVTSVALSGGQLTTGDTLTLAVTSNTFGINTAVTGLSFTTSPASAKGTYTLKANVNTTLASKDTYDKYNGLEVTFSLSGAAADGSGTISISGANSLTLQIGADNNTNQQVQFSIGDMSTTGLGLTGLDISTQPNAQSAITTIKTAINTVDGTRADLGALQNRLEHTSNNLSTMNENLTSAQSTIKDVDMSSEMVDLTKNQILEQAATSMLAQANSLPQNVLSLLKG